MARVSMTRSSIPFLNSSPSDLRRVNRHSVMAFASLKKETSSLGARVTEGQGNLPKVVLTSPHGRHDQELIFVMEIGLGSAKFVFVSSKFSNDIALKLGDVSCVEQCIQAPEFLFEFFTPMDWTLAQNSKISPGIT
ncbi:hypothetical protein CsSME_00003406 [Camellia sinensis var. sinensis]